MSLILALLVMLLMAVFGGMLVRDNEKADTWWLWVVILIALFAIGWTNHSKTTINFKKTMNDEAVLRGHACYVSQSIKGKAVEVLKWFNIGECKHYKESK